MYRWNTKDLVKKLSPLGKSIRVDPPGGDHDTDKIVIAFSVSKHFYISGWDPEKCLSQAEWGDVDVGMITLGDGQYQDTAISCSDPGMIQLYADILKVLKRETDGTHCGITHHWKQFF